LFFHQCEKLHLSAREKRELAIVSQRQHSGAQSERRGRAGPVVGLPVRTQTGRFLVLPSVRENCTCLRAKNANWQLFHSDRRAKRAPGSSVH